MGEQNEPPRQMTRAELLEALRGLMARVEKGFLYNALHAGMMGDEGPELIMPKKRADQPKLVSSSCCCCRACGCPRRSGC